jgi:hypothetical protein
MAHEQEKVLAFVWFENLRSGKVKYTQQENARQIIDIFYEPYMDELALFDISEEVYDMLDSIVSGVESPMFDEFMSELIKSPPVRFVEYIYWSSIYELGVYDFVMNAVHGTSCDNECQYLIDRAGIKPKHGQVYCLVVETSEQDKVKCQKFVLIYEDYSAELPADDEDEDNDGEKVEG